MQQMQTTQPNTETLQVAQTTTETWGTLKSDEHGSDMHVIFSPTPFAASPALLCCDWVVLFTSMRPCDWKLHHFLFFC